MENNKHFKNIESCRVCKNNNLMSYLDLGILPLANNFLTEEDEITNEERYPLDVMLCKDCYFSQLSVVVDPEHLFRNYAYSSTISNTFKDHCRQLAKELTQNKTISKGEKIVDIASNDGSLLIPFKDLGISVLGVDPARNMAKKANDQGVETICEFWNADLANDLLKSHGKAKIITAFNVFAHVDDMHSFVEGAKILLDERGFLIIESPHILNLIENTEFDTIYHEHLSYLSLKPLVSLMNEHGLHIAKVETHPIHGGSIRMYIEHDHQNRNDGSVEKLLLLEKSKGLYNIECYLGYQKKVNKIKTDLTKTIEELKKEKKSVAGFGASAKGNTLLNYCGIDSKSIEFIFDDTPEKQNKLAPGVHISIISSEFIKEKNPDYLLLLAWNFAPEIMEKTKEFSNKGGHYIIPIPEVKVI